MKKQPTVALYLRVPLWLHEAIELSAAQHNISITQHCYAILAGQHKEGPINGRNDQKNGPSLSKLVRPDRASAAG